jgi:hypothetical protein
MNSVVDDTSISRQEIELILRNGIFHKDYFDPNTQFNMDANDKFAPDAESLRWCDPNEEIPHR